jgi:hypothetical protein
MGIFPLFLPFASMGFASMGASPQFSPGISVTCQEKLSIYLGKGLAELEPDIIALSYVLINIGLKDVYQRPDGVEWKGQAYCCKL